MKQLGAAVTAAVLVWGSSASAETKVEVVRERAAVAGCANLGEVRGKSMLGGALANMAYDRALKSLKKQASDLGATHVLLLDVSAGFAGNNMLGTAHSCEAGRTELVPQQTPLNASQMDSERP